MTRKLKPRRSWFSLKIATQCFGIVAGTFGDICYITQTESTTLWRKIHRRCNLFLPSRINPRVWFPGPIMRNWQSPRGSQLPVSPSTIHNPKRCVLMARATFRQWPAHTLDPGVALTDFGDILPASFQEDSNYNSVQARLGRRFSNGLAFLQSYASSHPESARRTGTLSLLTIV